VNNNRINVISNISLTNTFAHLLKISIALLLSASLFACASTSESESGDTAAPVSEASAGGTASESAPASDTTEAAPAASDAAAPGDSTAAAAPAVEPEAITPPKIVESCKDEPFGKYEKQARESIAKGLAATKADTFGVGFRNVAEHNKWSKTHSTLFKSVNDACNALAECAKQHKKDKDTECVAQAKTFATWQGLAKSFAEKAKSVETTEPPIICSLEPNLDDPADCFHGLAANITNVCDTDECKEVSDCWRGVGFLDGAITQSKKSCDFVHQKLETCRGYIEATKRREDKFKHCGELQNQLNITIFPVL